MRAWTFSRRGVPQDVLRLVDAYPTPPPPERDELLIRVSYVALNSGSIDNMAMIPSTIRYLLRGGSSLPAIAEGEFSGVIIQNGPLSSSQFPCGMKVFGNMPLMRLIAGEGTLAEYITVPSSCVATAPSKISMKEAAGLSGAGQTAIDMIMPVDMKPGQRALVNGSTGGVGMMAVQLLKARGAYVVATCSEASFDLVKRLGANEVCLAVQ